MGIPYSHISFIKSIGASQKANPIVTPPEEMVDKEFKRSDSLHYIKAVYKNQWESTEDIPYADSIYKMIDDVIEYQLDKMSDMELADFYRIYMQRHYTDRRNVLEFNDAWIDYKDIGDM